MTVNVVCCLKQVPNTAEIKIDPETNTLIRAGVESIANPYDLVALEAALQLKEQYGGRVTAISMGPPQADEVLREAMALGADEAFLLCDRLFAGADTLATSYALTCAIRKLAEKAPIDLVLCGKQAIDGDTAQVGPGIATRLGFTQFTYVTEIQRLDGQITVKRRVEGGFQVVRGGLPAVLTAELDLARPRRASLPGLVHALQTVIPLWSAADVGALPEKIGLKGSPTWVRTIFSPPPKTGGPAFDAATDPKRAVEDCLRTLLSDDVFGEQLMNRWER